MLNILKSYIINIVHSDFFSIFVKGEKHMKMKKKTVISKEEYIKIQKKLNREIELERNGGRWVSVNRVHESKKRYNRKRNKKINLDDSYSFF